MYLEQLCQYQYIIIKVLRQLTTNDNERLHCQYTFDDSSNEVNDC